MSNNKRNYQQDDEGFFTQLILSPEFEKWGPFALAVFTTIMIIMYLIAISDPTKH